MRQPSEEEIRALEAEMEKLTVDDVLLQTIVTLINLGARKAGLAEGTQADLPQVKQAIDAARALLPIVEPRHGEALDRLKAWTGADIVLPELNGAQRQRRMIDAGATPFEVYAKCVEETRSTYETAV